MLNITGQEETSKRYWENENGANDLEFDDSHDDLEARSNARKIARSSKL